MLNFVAKQGNSQKGKKFSILHELRNKMQLKIWVHCEPLSGFSGGPGGKALEKFIILRLKLV